MTIIDDYQRFVKKGSYTKMPYIFATLGIAGEAGEILEAVLDGDPYGSPEEVILEIGDNFWYLTVLNMELGYDLTDLIHSFELRDLDPAVSAARVSVSASKIADRIKKVIRDNGGQVDGEQRTKLEAELKDHYRSLVEMSAAMGVGVADVLEANIKKLLERYPGRYGGFRAENGAHIDWSDADKAALGVYG